MLLERGVMVGESIRLSQVSPRFEFRSDAIRLSLFFNGSRPCSCSLFRLCFSGCSGIPLCMKLQSVRWRIVDEKKQCGVVLPQNHCLFIYLLTKYIALNFAYVTATQVAKRDETVLGLQSELDATQQEYETCSAELSERETEIAEMKTKTGQLEAELKGLKAQKESDESKVSYMIKWSFLL